MRFLLIIIVFVPAMAGAQIISGSGEDISEKKESTGTVSEAFGLEVDVTPFILKGYMGTAWIGVEKFRLRVSYAESVLPQFIVDDDVSQESLTVFAVNTEIFYNQSFDGFWFGPGLGIWNSKYRFNGVEEDSTNRSFVFTFGAGYNKYLWKNLYVAPWAALHTRFTGMDPRFRGRQEYSPMRFTPEISVKLGWRFGKAN